MGLLKDSEGSTPNYSSLEEFSGYNIPHNHSYSNAVKLKHTSLISILDRLPQVSATRTITLGQTNKLKLSAEEIAIATQKGWTVA